MEQPEIITILHEAVRDALEDGDHELDEADLIRRADTIIASLPTLAGGGVTAGLLLRRYQPALQRELCRGGRPFPTPPIIEDEVREITRAVMVAIEAREGISVEASVLLALALRARGLDTLCALPASGKFV